MIKMCVRIPGIINTINTLNFSNMRKRKHVIDLTAPNRYGIYTIGLQHFLKQNKFMVNQ